MTKLTYERVRHLFDYDPELGVLINKHNRSSNSRKGDIVGQGCTNNEDGYLVMSVDGILYTTHTITFLWYYGYFPEKDIDHIDQNKLNCRHDNLREASHSCNLKNSGLQKNNKSGIVGVSYLSKKQRWFAQINSNGVHYHLGYHKEKINAVIARYKGEQKHGWDKCNPNTTAYIYLKEKGVINDNF